MLNKELEATLNLSFKEARERRHEFITVEHLLLALLDNSTAAHVLHACHANLSRLRVELAAFITETTPVISAEHAERDTQPTLGFQRVLQRAVFQVQSAGKTEVNGANVLVAIYGEQDSQAVYFLLQENITRLDIINYLAHGITKVRNNHDSMQHESVEHDNENAEDRLANQSHVLENFCINLNQRAKQGQIDPVIGRKGEIERTIQVLCRRRKNNPLLVGEAGVGKTAIAEGLAKLIVDGEVPEPIAHSTVYALDLGALVAGTKYRGDFEKRLKDVLRHMQQDPQAIMFIDEIHTIIGAGSASGGVMDASNLLKPALADGQLRCIGSTTYQEFRGIFEKDRALARRFQKIDILEPSIEDTVKILHGLKNRLEKHHGIKYSASALQVAAQLAARFISDRMLPDKAIDVVDEAGAYQRLLPAAKRKKQIGVNEIEQVIAKMARIPTQQVSANDKLRLKNLERDLKLLVFGQEKAIQTLSSAIKLARSGLKDPQKPVGSFLFAGPTGVGKTEITRQLAKVLGIELIRFDMSEYMERHTVSRLIGAPPGYVGYEHGGLLTEAVNKHPHAVVLLDEIEKAHPDVYNLLLQVMDHGTLTDTNGRKVDFRHVILVMTTNAGALEASRASLGFTKQDHSTDNREAINKAFSPEFRNRLDAIVLFDKLDHRTIGRVFDKLVMELEAQLETKNVTLDISPAARDWFVTHGYDENLGARPMARIMQEHVKKPLAEEILFGKLHHGGTASIEVQDGGISLKVKLKNKKLRASALEE